MNAIRVYEIKANQVSSRTQPVRSGSTLVGFFGDCQMKRIPLTQGKFALVDNEDFEELNQYKWYFSRGYAVRNIGKWPNQRNLFMHRQIMNVLPGLETDHKNHIRLDNRRANLRICTSDDNRLNQLKRGKQKYKGVRRAPKSNKYEARIQADGKHIRLGLFNSEIEAAGAYDKAAKELFGEFACTNF